MTQPYINHSRQVDVTSWPAYGIQAYGKFNDFPQAVMQIGQASKTATECLDIFADFVAGAGFDNRAANDIVVNENDNGRSFLWKIVEDYTRFNGFAIHINYNMNYNILNMRVIPFEFCRLEIPDKNDNTVRHILVHSDWTHENNNLFKPWSITDARKYDIFDPRPDVIARQVEAAGGWENYRGQVYYFNGNAIGEYSYPVPKYVAELTDMRTEEALANVAARNVCNNFLTSGILVLKGEEPQNEAQRRELQEMLEKFQGDTAALQLWLMYAKTEDDVPQVVPFSGENYDNKFKVTQETIPDNIGSIFKQPPVLRAKDVAGNIGAELMTNAYKYYNTVTARDREKITDVLEMLFSYWREPVGTDFVIKPLAYNAGSSFIDRYGAAAVQQVANVLNSDTLTIEQKRNTLHIVFGFLEDEAIILCPNDATQL